MKKTTLFLLLFIIIFSTCEKDDFCTQNPVTSRLIITFYDDTNKETSKNVQRFSIIGLGKIDSLYKNQTLDSIALPLNSNEEETIYIFKRNNTTKGLKEDNEIDTLIIKHTIQEEYVSRSCGFKVLFNNLEFSPTNNWITDFTPTTTVNLDDQTAAHVQIFH